MRMGPFTRRSESSLPPLEGCWCSGTGWLLSRWGWWAWKPPGSTGSPSTTCWKTTSSCRFLTPGTSRSSPVGRPTSRTLSGSASLWSTGWCAPALCLLKRSGSLVHPQNRLSAKCYAGRYETTDLRASALGRRARGIGGGPALVGSHRPPSVPDPACQLQRRERLPDRPLVGLRSPDSTHRHKALQRGGHRRGVAQALFPTQEGPRRLRGGPCRAVGRDASSEPQGVRQGHEPVDLGASCGGEFRGRDHRGAGEC